VRGSVTEVLDYFRQNEPRGEFVLIVAGKPKPNKNRNKEDRYDEADDNE
jgi:16S rRNA (cytidine1402-2'-O)-methyltransferase